MSKVLIAGFILLTSVAAWACPNCNDTVSSVPKPPYTLIILAIFILSTYVPFTILFRAAKKFDPKNMPE